MTALLDLKNATKRFGAFTALNNASLQVHAGKVLGFVGSNGAGKSTLIKIITGAHQASEGEIFVRGEAVENADPSKMRALGIACVYQHSSLVQTLSVSENIFLGQQITRPFGVLNRKAQNQKLKELMDEYEIHLDPQSEVSKLTPVAQKQVEILKAMVSNADVILMDEPTAWLSYAEIKNLHATIRTLTSRGKGVVYISHVLDEVFDICDAMTILRDGEVVWNGPRQDMTRPKLVDLMVGERLGNASRAADRAERYPRGNGVVRLKAQDMSRSGVFEKICFDLYEGEILCLTGLIGAKRSDVVKAIFGVGGFEGSVTINGNPVAVNTPAKAVKAGLALVPEDRLAEGLLLHHTITENIMLPSIDTVSKKSFLNQRAISNMTARQIDSLNIVPADPKKVVGRMSGGNQQKVLLAKWLETEPQVLILDEPTVGVDVGAKAEIYDTIRKLRDEGACILMVSSDLEEVMAVSDRILVFREGRIVKQFDANAVNRNDLLNAIGGGEVLEDNHDS